jgi:hypothetical protein
MRFGELQKHSIVEPAGTPGHRGLEPRKRNAVLSLSQYLSTTGHVKSGWKLRGPPRKAKYFLVTDSGLVP